MTAPWMMSKATLPPEGLPYDRFSRRVDPLPWQLRSCRDNRPAQLFPEIIGSLADADIIAGKIANDQTARTLQLYVSGAYGTPGTEQADDIAIATLLPNRLENQYCFRTASAVEVLAFAGYEVVGNG